MEALMTDIAGLLSSASIWITAATTLFTLLPAIMAIPSAWAYAGRDPPQQRQGIRQLRRFNRILVRSLFFSLVCSVCILNRDYVYFPVSKVLNFSSLFSDRYLVNMWLSLKAMLEDTCEALWMLPPLFVTKVVSGFKFQKIADTVSRGIPGAHHVIVPTLSNTLAEAWFGAMVPTLFLFQSHLLSMIAPVVLRSFVSALHLSLLFSLSVFEYTWFSRGWRPHQRVSYVENNWVYFVCFGLPIVFVTSLSSSFFVRAFLFCGTFAMLFLHSLEATPITRLTRYPVRWFAPAVWVADALFQFEA